MRKNVMGMSFPFGVGGEIPRKDMGRCIAHRKVMMRTKDYLSLSWPRQRKVKPTIPRPPKACLHCMFGSIDR